ncbi:MAG: hypothetical protein HC843_03810 [Sphingomonadales bacterium]|nr:hypothetical protein [Sphingomonadales bacterium]
MTNILAVAFADNAGLFPHRLEMISDRVLISQMDETAFRSASFLDQRIMTPQLNMQLAEWSELESAPFSAAPPPHYIFHIGHVGSTLISRLLGEWDTVLALREPMILRDLVEIWSDVERPYSRWSPDQYQTRRDLVIRWLSRSFHKGQQVMIKASSFVSPLAPQLIGTGNKALFLTTSLESYMLTILAGEASMQETMAMAPARLKRLTALLGEPPDMLWNLAPAQRVAMSWLCEMVTLRQAEKIAPKGTVKWQDFDVFLNAPDTQLTAIAAHFNLPVSAAHLHGLLQGPIMRSYSKAPEHGYSADLRRDVQREAKLRHAADVMLAITWVEQLSVRHAAIADALNFWR